MKKGIITGVIVVGIAFLGGCATAGNEKIGAATNQSINREIVKGVTTKDQVQGMFGQPDKVDFNGGLEQWTYNFAHATPKAINFVPIANLFVHGANVTKKELVVLFDDKNVVKNYSFTSGKSVVKAGIAE